MIIGQLVMQTTKIFNHTFVNCMCCFMHCSRWRQAMENL